MKYLTIQKFIQQYPFSRTKLYELLAQKKIVGKKLGGRTLVDVESAEAFLAKLPTYQAQSGR